MKMIVGIPLFWCWMVCVVMGSLIRILLLIGVTAAVVWILRRICGSGFSYRHSHVGRELQKYGDLKTVKRDVEEQARQALYCSGDQALTEKYLILAREMQDTGSLFRLRQRLCLISTREIQQIAVQSASDLNGEGYTMFFMTYAGEKYQLTVWETFGEVNRIRKRLEECSRLGTGPVMMENGSRAARAEQRRIRKERIQAGLTAATVQECYKKKKKVCIGVYIAVLCIFVLVIIWACRLDEYSLSDFLRDLRVYTTESLLIAAAYLVPIPLVFWFVCWMERQVLRNYNRLKYFEQQEMDRLIVESPELKVGDVIYGKRCFWFRDFHYFCLHNLIFYEDVLWVYLSSGVFQTTVKGVDMPALYMHKIVFYTKDGRKHSIYMGNGRYFSGCFPDAIKGYGKEQKKAYKERRKEYKGKARGAK